MTLHVPEGRVLHLGRDLTAGFPPELVRLTYPALLALLEEVDPTPSSLLESGTEDWAELADRMHFITDFFRCYHAWEPLSEAPFTREQPLQIKAGQCPQGPL